MEPFSKNCKPNTTKMERYTMYDKSSAAPNNPTIEKENWENGASFGLVYKAQNHKVADS